MYRNVVYNNKTREIKLFTWQSDGTRVVKHIPFSPYYYTETASDTPDATSIFGSKLKKHVFNNDWDRRQSIKNSSTKRTYNNLPPVQSFLIDTFWKVNKKPIFSQHPLSIFYLDIEVYSPNEFPDEWEAKHPINVISIYNSLKNEMRVFCKDKMFDPDNLSDENCKGYDKIKADTTITCSVHSSEKELLIHFINYWKEDYPDVVTGWNLPFDIPYIINRIGELINERGVNLLSPTGYIRETIVKKKIGNQENAEVRQYDIQGVTILDYQDVYMKFSYKPVPNRKLDTILQMELKRGKVKYESSNLAKLSKEDWDLYVYYNIEDVNGIKLLEEKLHYLKIARMLAYMGLVPLNKALDTLPIVNGYCAVNSYEEGMVIPTFDKSGSWSDYAGGYVKEPVPGIYDNVVSFDLNSLYPMTMITLNCSPETKFGKIEYTNGGSDVILTDNTGKSTLLTVEKLHKLMNMYELSLSKSNILFTQRKKGIFPKMVDEVYVKRLDDQKNKRLLKDKLKDATDPTEISRLKDQVAAFDVAQYSKKIFINSCYGYLGNKYACMSDVDIAESITVTCQSIIQESCRILDDINNVLTGK